MERKLPFQQKIEATQSAENLYKTFDEEQKRFAATQQIKGKHKIKNWLKLLEKMALLDEKLDEGRPKGIGTAANVSLWQIAAFFCFMLAAISIFLLVVADFSLKFLLFFLLTALGGGLSVKRILKLQSLYSADLQNHFRLVVMPLLYVLQEEAGEDAKLQMRLDFSKPNSPAYQAKAPAEAAEPPINTTAAYYAIVWLELELEFANGTLLAIELSDFVREFTRRRRNRRGRTKVKTKYKTKYNIKTILSVPKEHYKLSSLATKTKLKEKDTHFVVQAEQQQTYKSLFNTHIHQDLMPLLACLSECYKTVSPV